VKISGSEVKGADPVDLLVIFMRTILIYFVVLAVMRLMGKREVGKLSVFDLVVSIMIAEISIIVIEDAARPMINGLVPLLTLVGVQILVSYVSLKSDKIRHFIEGKPTILINRGKLQEQEMKSTRYNLDDLLIQLREKSIANVADVEFAILEPSGKLSVFTKTDKEHDTKEDLFGDHIEYKGLPLPVILDGKVQDDNLQKLGKTRFWLKNKIQEKGCNDFKEVFFASIDHRGKIFLDVKDRKK
jgi:uncharacterized membrane protein YcaP (DUF421 family)